MAMRSRYMRVQPVGSSEGVNLKERFGLMYSSFEETLPEPKTIFVSIPAGVDIDLSEAVGALGWKNGKHKLKFLLYGETQAERLEKKRDLIALMHGVRMYYRFSWDSTYTYTGRAKVSFEHKTENADLVTIEIERQPWKTSGWNYIEVDSHPTGTASLNGSKKYQSVSVILKEAATVTVGDGDPQSLAAGTHTLASEIVGDTDIVIDVGSSGWAFYLDGTNLVTNPALTTLSGNDVTLNTPSTISGTNIVFSLANLQISTVQFRRVDL